jgi:hypothetical protein
MFNDVADGMNPHVGTHVGYPFLSDIWRNLLTPFFKLGYPRADFGKSYDEHICVRQLVFILCCTNDPAQSTSTTTTTTVQK